MKYFEDRVRPYEEWPQAALNAEARGCSPKLKVWDEYEAWMCACPDANHGVTEKTPHYRLLIDETVAVDGVTALPRWPKRGEQ
jgi:hypothetical protein